VESIVLVNASHGGFDGGAVANDGTVEKNINLQICLTLEQLLKTGGYDVIMTRSSDTSTEDNREEKIASRKKSDLKNRLGIMKNNPDAIFVSVHLNKFTTSSASGSQVFYSGKKEESKVLGEDIQSSIIEYLQPFNDRVNKKATSSTYLLYNATVPAVLVECGFLSNRNELELLKTEEYQKQMAFCIYCGINNYFGKLTETKET
jgi:N-acetylmuramoyl-L-alanine amidase